MPYGIRAASASMIQINKELEEASLAAGGTWFQTFRKVILPLLMPGFTAGWIYISIIALRELSTSILLYSYNSTVLSIMAFDLWEGGQYTYVCALGYYGIVAPRDGIHRAQARSHNRDRGIDNRSKYDRLPAHGS
jgi:iron(III) transport system permease protein